MQVAAIQKLLRRPGSIDPSYRRCPRAHCCWVIRWSFDDSARHRTHTHIHHPPRVCLLSIVGAVRHRGVNTREERERTGWAFSSPWSDVFSGLSFFLEAAWECRSARSHTCEITRRYLSRRPAASSSNGSYASNIWWILMRSPRTSEAATWPTSTTHDRLTDRSRLASAPHLRLFIALPHPGAPRVPSRRFQHLYGAIAARVE